MDDQHLLNEFLRAAERSASTPTAGAKTQVKFVNETNRTLSVEISEIGLEPGSSKGMRLKPKETDVLPVPVGRRTLRVQEVKLLGTMILSRGASFERAVEVEPDRVIRITDGDFSGSKP